MCRIILDMLFKTSRRTSMSTEQVLYKQSIITTIIQRTWHCGVLQQCRDYTRLRKGNGVGIMSKVINYGPHKLCTKHKHSIPITAKCIYCELREISTLDLADQMEVIRLRSLVEATETDLFDQKKKRRRLEKRWEKLGEWIKSETAVPEFYPDDSLLLFEDIKAKMKELQAGSK